MPNSDSAATELAQLLGSGTAHASAPVAAFPRCWSPFTENSRPLLPGWGRPD